MDVTLDQLEREPYALLARLRASEPVVWIGVLDGWDGVGIAMRFAPETVEYVGPGAEETHRR